PSRRAPPRRAGPPPPPEGRPRSRTARRAPARRAGRARRPPPWSDPPLPPSPSAPRTEQCPWATPWPDDTRRGLERCAKDARSVRDQAEQVVVAQALPASQEPQLDERGDAHHLAAKAFDERGRRLRGAPGGQHVVDDEDTFARRDRVGVDLQR